MDTQDIRRARLAQLIAERYKSQADFVASTGENQGEISGLLKTKSFGEKKARKLEVKAGLPQGWLDDASGAPDDAAEHQRQNGFANTSAPPWMAAEAHRLLTLYYEADDDGRAEIMNTALDFSRAARQRVVHNKAQ
ncbi:MAG: hypothetical protein ABIT83_20175 [Massilia sp.]